MDFCEDPSDEQCDLNRVTFENEASEQEQLEQNAAIQMKYEDFVATIWLGLVQTLNAILPLIFFYTWRRSVVSFDALNSFYDKAWQILVWTHLGLNGLPALLWPFTYLESLDGQILSTIRHFYWYALFSCGFVLFNLTALWNTTAFVLSATYYFSSDANS